MREGMRNSALQRLHTGREHDSGPSRKCCPGRLPSSSSRTQNPQAALRSEIQSWRCATEGGSLYRTDHSPKIIKNNVTRQGMGLEVESGYSGGKAILRQAKGVEDAAATRTPGSAYEL